MTYVITGKRVTMAGAVFKDARRKELHRFQAENVQEAKNHFAYFAMGKKDRYLLELWTGNWKLVCYFSSDGKLKYDDPDYDITVPEDDDYDLKVSEDDDYDKV